LAFADVGGEELYKPPGRPVAGGRNLHRQKGVGPVNDNEVFSHGFSVSHFGENREA